MFTSNSAEETVAIGRGYGTVARKGDVFALAGDLGAGKTQFVTGFVAALESRSDVTSPTFTLLHEYNDGRLPVYHFDFYRLETSEVVARLGFDDYIFGDGVCLIEWADRFSEIIPEKAKWIRFEWQTENTRVIRE